MVEKLESLRNQVGGDHYKAMAIEPAQFAHANNLGFLEGSAIKYLSRHKRRGKSEDVRKAMQFCCMILEMEYGEKYSVCLTVQKHQGGTSDGLRSEGDHGQLGTDRAQANHDHGDLSSIHSQ